MARGAGVGALTMAGAVAAVVPLVGAASPAQALAMVPAGQNNDAARVHVQVECVLDQHDGTYRAVFGYQLDGRDPVAIPNGQANFVIPRAFAGTQPTEFTPGLHHGAWTAPPVANNQKTSWRIAKVRVDAYSTDTACGDPVDLPADGNGTGTAIVLLAAAGVGGVLVYRDKRAQRPTSDLPREPEDGGR